jgi:hypothetical protein
MTTRTYCPQTDGTMELPPDSRGVYEMTKLADCSFSCFSLGKKCCR